jgi:hypothetical protein
VVDIPETPPRCRLDARCASSWRETVEKHRPLEQRYLTPSKYEVWTGSTSSSEESEAQADDAKAWRKRGLLGFDPIWLQIPAASTSSLLAGADRPSSIFTTPRPLPSLGRYYLLFSFAKCIILLLCSCESNSCICHNSLRAFLLSSNAGKLITSEPRQANIDPVCRLVILLPPPTRVSRPWLRLLRQPR